MLTRDDLHSYQRHAVDYIKDKKRCGLFLPMGMGKTATTLTATSDLLDDFIINRALIVAPLRVANTVWKQECANWDHLQDLDIGVCTGTPHNRQKVLLEGHDITVINRENIPWLVKNWKWDFDALVIDESSSFKSHKSQRFKALKAVQKKINYLVELTGTPSPNGIADLWSQLYLIDKGARLGKTVTAYRQRFFIPAGFGGYQWEPRKGAADQVQELIADVCLSMKAEDYLDLPDRIDTVARVDMPPKAQEQYDELEKEFLLELDAVDITAPTAAAKAGKLLQLANGAVYDENGTAHIIHDVKIDALKDFIEDNAGENILVAYNFKSDLVRLKKTFPKAVVLDKAGDAVAAWNSGEIELLLAHPASAGHGLNLQHGGAVVLWFGLNWSLELYQQFNARLHRQGQERPVRIVHIVARGTIDERVMLALGAKAKTQNDLLEYLKINLEK